MIPIPLSLLNEYRREFVEGTGLGTEAYRITPRSPWPSEIFALYAFGRRNGITTWLEGGTYHGQAAEVLAKAAPTTRVVTVELFEDIAAVARSRLQRFVPRVQVEVGDARDVLPPLADSATGSVGVFLDGPKGPEAAFFAMILLARYRRVSFVGMHDMPQSVMGRAVPARAALEELARYEPEHRGFWATDDPEYVAWCRDLDADLHAAHVTESGRSGWRPYEHFAEGQPTFQMRSYGPTVSFLLRTER